MKGRSKNEAFFERNAGDKQVQVNQAVRNVMNSGEFLDIFDFNTAKNPLAFIKTTLEKLIHSNKLNQEQRNVLTSFVQAITDKDEDRDAKKIYSFLRNPQVQHIVMNSIETGSPREFKQRDITLRNMQIAYDELNAAAQKLIMNTCLGKGDDKLNLTNNKQRIIDAIKKVVTDSLDIDSLKQDQSLAEKKHKRTN